MEPRNLDLNLVVANMNAMLRRVIGEDIELTSHLEADRGRVKADRSQLEQVLLNLAVNARDAMPKGGTLKIETQDVELGEQEARRHGDVPPGHYVMLAVSDTGQGIDEHTLSLVFEPFFTTKEEGTGLGLSTVYGIVKQSGGHIWVDSKPYLGTRFKVYLPRVDASADEEAAGVTPGASLAGSETVLLVEDDEDVRTVTTQSLVERGYTVWDAAGAEEALRISDEHSEPIQLLITDVVLPRMNGTKLARILTSIRPGLKVLYMSGYTGSAGDERGVLRPDDQYVEKPFSPETLARKVREVLAG
jgi:DNA-binding response OmpR family regulator